MLIKQFILGAFETNCYVLREGESAKDCLIIDTGLEVTELMTFLTEEKLNPLAVVLTHGHADHITGVENLRKEFPEIKVYIHKLDDQMLKEPKSNLSFLAGSPYKTDSAEKIVEDGDIIKEAGIELEVFHTPGHTQGGICLYHKEENVLFSGDTLFADSVGRTDFPGGNMTQLVTSIKQKLCPLPENTIVLPGHGPSTTIEQEKKYNQYLQ